MMEYIRIMNVIDTSMHEKIKSRGILDIDDMFVFDIKKEKVSKSKKNKK